MKFIIPIAVFILCAALALFSLSPSVNHVVAGAPSGLPATIATSSNPTVDTSQRVVFATSTCAARIVTTVASPVMMTFGDQVPTGTYGHLQPASTTVAYDSGLYGCGQIRMYGFVSSAITVSELR